MSDDARALRRWLCEACGLVYDEARGDPDSGLAPGSWAVTLMVGKSSRGSAATGSFL